LRSLSRESQCDVALLAELDSAGGRDARYDTFVDGLLSDLPNGNEASARYLVERLALALQAAVLLRAHSPIADAFIASRLLGQHGFALGTLARDMDFSGVIARALP
jgi:putative acyl-CoA dehydrogenase